MARLTLAVSEVVATATQQLTLPVLRATQAISSASRGSVLLAMGEARHRAKVYCLNDEGQWDDRGTGHAAVQYMPVRATPLPACTTRAPPSSLALPRLDAVPGCKRLLPAAACSLSVQPERAA